MIRRHLFTCSAAATFAAARQYGSVASTVSLKRLASHTLLYGVSSILAKFINYLLTPYLTRPDVMSDGSYGRMGAVYALIPLLAILFTYGMETAYFRFVQQKDKAATVNYTASVSLIATSLLFTALLWTQVPWLARIISVSEFPDLVRYALIIIAFDALSTIPFARLRQEGRPLRFAVIRLGGILINVFFTWFFLSYCRARVEENSNSFFILIYSPGRSQVTYILWANLLQSLFTFALLFRWLLPKEGRFSPVVLKEMLWYAFPMLLAGIGYTVNETFDRLMLGWWLPGNYDFNRERAVYSAVYKLSILITLFVQAFRMGAEPFFFQQAQEQEKPQRTYARVMKFFVITLCCMFLFVVVYLPVLRHFVNEQYWRGLPVVPLLLVANMCLGVYINLSVWYKVTDATYAGAVVTFAGVAVTLAVNYWGIPRYSFMACAWATLLCYATMMVLSYWWGQKRYPIPYATAKLITYFVVALGLYGLHRWLFGGLVNIGWGIAVGTVFLLIYVVFLLWAERRELRQIPAVARWMGR